ncbi:hypothetical protein METEAL_07220 [Mesoterricola silvestris]|uniref:Uncharacterized protein n=1 Tax=Mesoterricola silvestris TaxID=2927979 RepID=A0AA48GWD3_9BACT|nr:hypothetical protein METEAL_07220 [Mesoterricola silvestris]
MVINRMPASEIARGPAEECELMGKRLEALHAKGEFERGFKALVDGGPETGPVSVSNIGYIGDSLLRFWARRSVSVPSLGPCRSTTAPCANGSRSIPNSIGTSRKVGATAGAGPVRRSSFLRTQPDIIKPGGPGDPAYAGATASRTAVSQISVDIGVPGPALVGRHSWTSIRRKSTSSRNGSVLLFPISSASRLENPVPGIEGHLRMAGPGFLYQIRGAFFWNTLATHS